ncbi:hypothetical protein D3C78_1273230 [compost metagenome]
MAQLGLKKAFSGEKCDYSGDEYRKERIHVSHKFIYYLSLCLMLLITICISGCSLSPDKATLDRQAKTTWWPGASISNEVYRPAVKEEVYAK